MTATEGTPTMVADEGPGSAERSSHIGFFERFSNPVLARELRQRMSTPRVMLVLSGYLAVLGLTVGLLYRARAQSSSSFATRPGVSEFAEIGQSLFETVLFFMMLLVLFIVPGFTAASIAGERERQTLRSLQVTLLSPLGIVLGKVGASIALTCLLVVSSMPILAIAYLVGGITFGEVFTSLGVVLFTAAALACVTVACSALVRRVPGAILMAYGVVLLLVFGSFVVYAIAGEYDRSRGVDAVEVPSWILAVNPLAAIAEVSDRVQGDPSPGEVALGPFGPQLAQDDDVSSPLSAIRYFMHEAFNDTGFSEPGFRQPFPAPVAIDEFGNPIFGGEAPGFDDRASGAGVLSFTSEFLLTLSVASVIGVLVAARRIRTPAHADR